MGVQGENAFAIPSRVVLAREQPFRLGTLDVEPVTREVRTAGERLTLEPRVMQVLIALARAKGEAVTRDDLIEWCWGGRIVSDDAINRVLSLVRRVASGIAGGSFAVETIPRVGYRLTLADEQKETPANGAADARFRLSRRAAVAGVIGLTAGTSFLGYRALSFRAKRSPEAEELFRRSVAILTSRRSEDYQQALSYITEAARLEPHDPQLLGALALASVSAAFTVSEAESAGYRNRAREAARQALEIDPDEVRANKALMILQPRFGNWAEHDLRSRRMIAAHPDDPLAVGTRADILMEMGRWREAEPLLVRKRKLLPFEFRAALDLLIARWSEGNLRGADETLAEALRLWPRERMIWDIRIFYFAGTGRTAEALDILDDGPNRPVPYPATELEPIRLFLLAKLGSSPASIAKAVDASLNLLRATSEWIFGSMDVLSMLGQTERAADLIRGVYMREGSWSSVVANARGDPPARILFESPLAEMRSHPVFEAAVRRIGLEDYWKSNGTQPDYRRFA